MTEFQKGFQSGLLKAKDNFINDEIKFISYILTGSGYTKEYYIQMLENRLEELKQKIGEIK